MDLQTKKRIAFVLITPVLFVIGLIFHVLTAPIMVAQDISTALRKVW